MLLVGYCEYFLSLSMLLKSEQVRRYKYDFCAIFKSLPENFAEFVFFSNLILNSKFCLYCNNYDRVLETVP